MSNGDLLATAESNRFELFITTDQNLRYQQNLTGRKIAILVLPTTRWPEIQNTPKRKDYIMENLVVTVEE